MDCIGTQLRVEKYYFFHFPVMAQQSFFLVSEDAAQFWPVNGG